MSVLSGLKYDSNGLIPAVVQDADGQVLMVGWMNQVALERTLASGKVTFWSRSRQKLWTKGETSGHFLNLQELYVDCDQDCLLVKATAMGPTCHEGYRSCFFRRIAEGGDALETIAERD